MKHLHESDIADEVYDLLFENTKNQTLNFVETFPDANVNRDFAQIVLNHKFVIKIERI
jgi:hypothetical protein